ncbi:hypothetical protein D3C86_1039290 [compost metagenome]
MSSAGPGSADPTEDVEDPSFFFAILRKSRPTKYAIAPTATGAPAPRSDSASAVPIALPTLLVLLIVPLLMPFSTFLMDGHEVPPLILPLIFAFSALAFLAPALRSLEPESEPPDVSHFFEASPKLLKSSAIAEPTDSDSESRNPRFCSSCPGCSRLQF